MEILERYFAALLNQDWESLGACVAENVHRTGPYLDVVRGRAAYVAFLARVIPTLRSYDLRVARIRKLDADSAVVELSEFAEVNGVRTEFPEVLLFDFDADGSILRIDIYIKQPPPGR
jgi:predicted ester cyclase